jgi:hypothetical protein
MGKGKARRRALPSPLDVGRLAWSSLLSSATLCQPEVHQVWPGLGAHGGRPLREGGDSINGGPSNRKGLRPFSAAPPSPFTKGPSLPEMPCPCTSAPWIPVPMCRPSSSRVLARFRLRKWRTKGVHSHPSKAPPRTVLPRSRGDCGLSVEERHYEGWTSQRPRPPFKGVAALQTLPMGAFPLSRACRAVCVHLHATGCAAAPCAAAPCG